MEYENQHKPANFNRAYAHLEMLEKRGELVDWNICLHDPALYTDIAILGMIHNVTKEN